MRHRTSWWTADHRGAPGWLIVAAAMFLAACAGTVATHPSPAADSAASGATSSETPFVLDTGGPETFVSVLGSSSSFVSSAWWDDSVAADEIPGAYADHVKVYPARSSAALAKHVGAATKATDYVIVQSGTNDLLAGRTAKQAVASLRSLWKSVQRHNATPIAALVPPSDSLPAEVKRLNTLITAAAKAQHVKVLDVYTPIAAADGSWAKKMSVDGSTPDVRASTVMTKAAIRQLKVLIKTGRS